MMRVVCLLSIVTLLATSSSTADVPAENLRCGSLQWTCGKGPHVLYTVPMDSMFVLTDLVFFAAPDGPCQYQVGSFFILNGVGGLPLWSEMFHWVLDEDWRMSGGQHSLAWDGLDDRGRQVPSGVYFARLDVGETPSSHRIEYLR